MRLARETISFPCLIPQLCCRIKSGYGVGTRYNSYWLINLPLDYRQLPKKLNMFRVSFKKYHKGGQNAT